jgi:hypothetical protein
MGEVVKEPWKSIVRKHGGDLITSAYATVSLIAAMASNTELPIRL